jgi:trk system potassium uptake protein TrkA
MYILIAGMGQMGTELAKTLLTMGHTIAVVDSNSLVCQQAREKIGVMAFEGSAVNTTVCKHYGVPQIIVRMSDRDFAEPYRLAGATHIMSTVELAINRMINAIEYPQVDAMMHFEQGQIEVLKLSIPNACSIVGRSVAEIAQDSRFPMGTLIIGYQAHPHEALSIPNGSSVIESGSTILAVTKPDLVRQLIDFMGLCAPAQTLADLPTGHRH